MAPRIVDKQAKRAEITGAAAQVFARKGFQGASVDDIAAAAGVSKGTVYGYFANKEELFYATFEAFQRELFQACEAEMAMHATAFDKLAGCLTLCVSSLQQDIQMFPLTLELWAAASTGSARERFAVAMEHLYREFRGLTTGIIKAGQASGEFRADVNPEGLAAWLVGGLDGMMLQYWFDQRLDVQGWTDNVLKLVRRGIAADS